jgi:hypothetical protein
MVGKHLEEKGIQKDFMSHSLGSSLAFLLFAFIALFLCYSIRNIHPSNFSRHSCLLFSVHV